jgi:adenylate kinase family enzyme
MYQLRGKDQKIRSGVAMRIAIIGPAGAGKKELGAKLGEFLETAHFNYEALAEVNTSVPEAVFRMKAYIVSGYPRKEAHNGKVPFDVVLLLSTPLQTCAERLILRKEKNIDEKIAEYYRQINPVIRYYWPKVVEVKGDYPMEEVLGKAVLAMQKAGYAEVHWKVENLFKPRKKTKKRKRKDRQVAPSAI